MKRNACKQDEIQRGKMVFLTIESANKAEITILSAPDTNTPGLRPEHYGSLGHGTYPDFLSYFFPKGFFSGRFFFWPPYNRSDVLVSGCPSLSIPIWWSLHVSDGYFWMYKEFTVYQDCIWYISCECMHVCMPRAIYALGWFSAGVPK